MANCGKDFFLAYAGDGQKFRSEAVALEVSLKEQLHKLELDVPPSAVQHKQRSAAFTAWQLAL